MRPQYMRRGEIADAHSAVTNLEEARRDEAAALEGASPIRTRRAQGAEPSPHAFAGPGSAGPDGDPDVPVFESSAVMAHDRCIQRTISRSGTRVGHVDAHANPRGQPPHEGASP